MPVSIQPPSCWRRSSHSNSRRLKRGSALGFGCPLAYIRHMTTSAETARRVTNAQGLAIAAVVLAAATIALIWLVAVPNGPAVCAAVYPAPRNCFEIDRVQIGVVVTALVALVGIATVLLALSKSSGARPFAVGGVVVLAAAPFVAYLLVAWIPALAG